MFLNCNYPHQFQMPKGKPKALKKAVLEIKKGNKRLIIDSQNNAWFVSEGYYFGVVLPKFIVKSMWGVKIFETIGKINLALNDWGDGRGNKYARLNSWEEDLLGIYLLTVR